MVISSKNELQKQKITSENHAKLTKITAKKKKKQIVLN